MKSDSVSFAALGVAPALGQILTARRITAPTPIQQQSIPAVMAGDDVLGVAQTGTGKTLAFVLPLVERFLAGQRNQTALILLPTRELAYQVQETVAWFERVGQFRSTVIVGGASMHNQVQQLRKNPQVIIATPGRLIDHLKQKTVNLTGTSYLVLDEADRMFDMGFAPQISQIMRHLPGRDQRQTLLFSATMPPAILTLTREHMRTPVHIEVAPQGTTVEAIRQELIVIDNAHRKDALLTLLAGTKYAILIFTRTKYQAKQLTKFLRTKGYRVEELHSNRSLPQRKRAIAAIQNRQAQILVATDVAARGIDISHLELVINFELPDNPEDYVHRIGRTGRAGRAGRAVSFVLTDQADQLRQIQRLISAQIAHTEIPGIPKATLSAAPSQPRRGRGGGRHGGRPGSGHRRRSGGGGQHRGGGSRRSQHQTRGNRRQGRPS